MVKRPLRRIRWGPLLWAALALALGPAAIAGSRVSAQDDVPLGIEAPETLVLGQEREVTLRIRAPSPLTASLTTNLGSLGEPQPSGEGEWQVRFTPPAARYPQLAIFALVSPDGMQLAWARTALHASATVELRSDPQVQVSVKVGDRTFGPVRTDKRGKAALAVIVPPGVSRAISTATDAHGNERVESISLDVPEITPLLAVCPAEDARDFVVLAARPDGEPATRLPLRAQATTIGTGEISEPEPGVYRTALVIPNGVQAGERARLSAALAGKPSAAVSCELAVPLERPQRLTVELSRARFVASETEAIRVRVVPEYVGVREKAAFTLGFKVDFGELSQTRVSAREPLELTWQLPQQLGARSEARLSLSGDLRRTLIVPLQAAAIEALDAQAAPARLPADGHSAARLRVTVRDRFGNPVRGAQLSATARGALSELTEAEAGVYEAEYRAPLGEPGDDVIVLVDAESGKKAEAAIEMWSRGGGFSLALHAGYLTNFARVAGPLVELELGYRLPLLRERLSLSLLVGYYQSSTRIAAADGGGRVRAKLWAAPALLRVAYTIPVGPVDLAPLLGAGVLSATTQVSSAATGSIDDRELTPLLTGGMTFGVALGPGRICLTLAYFWAVLKSDNVTGNAGGPHATLGYDLAL